MTFEDPSLLEKLLADRATGDLESAEHRELAKLLLDEGDDVSLDLAAAALDIGLAAEEEAMPLALAEKVSETAKAFLPEPDAPAVRAPKPRVVPRKASPIRTTLGVVGWLAAAASIVFAVYVWRDNQPTPIPDPQAQRELLLSDAADAVSLTWTATEDPAASSAQGDVLWSNERQKGFMRIQGLQANNPDQNQYQLWIFDGTRENPVDGGVFNIPEGATEVIIPIDAKLLVDSPQLFAITVEKPGGVVVSKRERIVLVADPTKAG